MRALKIDDTYPEENGEDEKRFRAADANLSAHLALIALDRSMQAWAVMRKHFKQDGDQILDLLLRLERLKVATEKQFPQARKTRLWTSYFDTKPA
jgi:hypothetical protein